MGDGRDSDRDFLARSARRAVVGAVVLVVVFAVLYVLKAALTPLAAAFVMAYLLDPVIDRFEKRGVRRSIAIFVLLGIVGFGVIGGILVLLPKLQAEVTALAYIVERAHHTYAGQLPLSLQARLIRSARGRGTTFRLVVPDVESSADDGPGEKESNGRALPDHSL